MLTFCNVQKIFSKGEKQWTFGPISLKISSGDFVAILGKSGSGKSTFLHLAGGLISPDSGEIFFEYNAGADRVGQLPHPIRDGDPIKKPQKQKKYFSHFTEEEKNMFRNKHIGFVFQEFFLLPEFTLLENTMFPLLIRGTSQEESEKKARNSLQKVGLTGKEQNYPKELSGGQRQRAAIARALISESDIIFADEPTGNLDLETGKEIIDFLCALHLEEKKTLVLVTHDEVLAKKAEKIITIEDGRVFSKK